MTTTRTPPEPVLTGRLADALGFAVDVHAGQSRKGGTIPYVSHLLAVAAIVLEHGGSEDQAIAGLLHDAAEDGPDNGIGMSGEEILAAIAERFGDDVARIVLACSDTTEHPKPPWHDRKQRYLAHLHEADADVVLVSAADKLHNLRSINADRRALGDAMFGRFKAGRDDVRWYYRSLIDVFAERLGEATPALVDLLRRELVELESG